MLDRSHHVDRAFTGLGNQKVHFVQPNAMLTRAGAAQAQSAVHQLRVQVFRHLALAWIVGIDQVTKMKVTITHMAHQKIGQAAGVRFRNRIKQAIRQFADGHTGVCADGPAAWLALQRRKVGVVAGRPQSRSLFWCGCPFK